MSKAPMPRSIEPMLATLGKLPLDDDGWAYELKWDGVRAIGYVIRGEIRLESRNGNDLTASFPELAALGKELKESDVILDGEVVALDEAGHPSFQSLQPRIHTTDPARAARMAAAGPVTFILFDLLYANGEPLLDMAYVERRQQLESLGLEKGASWSVSPRFEGPGVDVFQTSKEQGFEGIVAKRTASPYRQGKRSPEWTKVKNTLMQEVVIGGWTGGQGRRTDHVGSLLLGIPEGRRLSYVGQVGTGFTDAMLSDLAERLAPLEQANSPFSDEVPSRYARNAHWVKPRLVGEVTFGEWTKDRRLRHPSWRGLRDDKAPKEVTRES